MRRKYCLDLPVKQFAARPDFCQWHAMSLLSRPFAARPSDCQVDNDDTAITSSQVAQCLALDYLDKLGNNVRRIAVDNDEPGSSGFETGIQVV